MRRRVREVTTVAEEHVTGRFHGKVPREPLSLAEMPRGIGRALEIIERLRARVKALRVRVTNLEEANAWETANLRGQVGALEVQRAQARAAEDLMSMQLAEALAENRQLKNRVAWLEASVEAARHDVEVTIEE